MAELGCGTYEAYIFERGGEKFVTDIPWESLTWGRMIDDTSSGTVNSVIPIDAYCRPELADVRPWRHEVGLYRDGRRVWVGPILGIRPNGERYGVTMRDLTAWWDHRFVHNDHKYVVETDLATIFKDLADDAMATDPTPNLIVDPTATGIKSTMTVLAAQHQKAGVVLRDISKTSIDWTVVDRRVIVGGTTVPVNPIGVFTDDSFSNPPSPVLDGSQQANLVVVAGSGSGSAGATIYATSEKKPQIRRDGLLEDSQTLTTIQDYTAALAAAESRADLASQVVSVQDAVLAPTAPFSIDDLIPGALCELALEETIIPVSGLFRLQSVTVSAASASNTETVTLIFQPPGTLE